MTRKKTQFQQGLFGPLPTPKAKKYSPKKVTTSHCNRVNSTDARLVRVAFASGADNTFDYALSEELAQNLQPGQRVRVPFGRSNRQELAFCIGFPTETKVKRVKNVTEIVDESPLLNKEMMQLAQWISQYYFCPLGMVLSAMVPAAVKRRVGMVKQKYLYLTETGRQYLQTTVDGNLPSDGIRISAKGKAILEHLYLQDKETPLKKVAREIGCGNSPFKTLLKAGLIKQEIKAELTLPEEYEVETTITRHANDNNYCNANCDISYNANYYTETAKKPLPDTRLPPLPWEKQSSSPISKTQADNNYDNDNNASLSFEPDFELNEDQTAAVKKAGEIIDRNKFNVILLHGVTASGKTEVYIRCMEKVINKGQQILVLVPEIALTSQAVKRMLARFGKVAVLHSAMSATKRHQQWQLIARGQVDVVVGARSAIFAPLSRLGLIVIDEEHENSYKQDTTPRYHARDVAIKRAQMLGISIILGSATPSLETLYNTHSKDCYTLLTLPKRVLNLPLPKVAVVDMKEEYLRRPANRIISKLLHDQLSRCLKMGHQAILLLNRRGHSNFVFCPSCKFVLNCPNCDVSLTYHKPRSRFENNQHDEEDWVMCHYCFHSSRVPRLCPVCGKKLTLIGPGTQRAYEVLSKLFPQARIMRMDSDSVRARDYGKILGEFEDGKIDILLGTQMIGKGLDFPNVALVGVINADTSLSLPDFRSSERTFQLIYQVAGRCGRASNIGRVVVQTFAPDEPAVQKACQQDYNSFARYEMAIRKSCAMPPFYRLARIIMRDIKPEKLELHAGNLRKDIEQIIKKYKLRIHIHGPMPASIARLENYYRWEILLKAPMANDIQKLLAILRNTIWPSLKIQAVVDVDPVMLL